jgi:hypothetical protein
MDFTFGCFNSRVPWGILAPDAVSHGDVPLYHRHSSFPLFFFYLRPREAGRTAPAADGTNTRRSAASRPTPLPDRCICTRIRSRCPAMTVKAIMEDILSCGCGRQDSTGRVSIGAHTHLPIGDPPSKTLFFIHESTNQHLSGLSSPIGPGC